MLEARISLQYRSARVAESITKALSPDNTLRDRRMHVFTIVKGPELCVYVRNCEKIETLEVTLQDLFRCIRAAESSLVKLTTR